MKFKLPDSVTRTVARQILIGKKHSPTILFVGGVVGVGATVVTACRATLKLEEVLETGQTDREMAKAVLNDERHPEYTEADYKKDMTILYVRNAVGVCKLYAPAIVLGIVSIGALTGAHRIQRGRIAGLTAAYAALDQGFKDYRSRVQAEYGDDKDRELRHGVDTKTVVVEDKNGPKKKVMKTAGDGGGSIYAKFFDEFNVNWNPQPEHNHLFLSGQQKYANQRLQARGHLFLNELYEELGFEHTKEGALVGWIWNKGNGDDYVDFGIWDDRSMTRFHDFLVGKENGIWLDFNVDGVIYDKI